MNNGETRIERDSLGEVEVPVDALYGAQTQRAINNFPIGSHGMPPLFIQTLALVKWACAKANAQLGFLETDKSSAIQAKAMEIYGGKHLSHFPISVYQTGSGTSSNMNANEVIAHLASEKNLDIHPNDHVNMSQSSNDVIPTTVHLSASLSLKKHLFPALTHLIDTLKAKKQSIGNIPKTGRTHLMDAMPLTFGQEISGWIHQIEQSKQNIEQILPSLCALALGGTAVGTGINAHPDFAKKTIDFLAQETGLSLSPSSNYFFSISTQDSIVAMSSQLKALACSLMKMSNDVRWMNSGPLTGLGEITLKALQPGSSIMPGKINPVIPEALCMVCAKVIGNDSTITIAGQSGNFQLNVMLPVIALSILESIELLSDAMHVFADNAIKDFEVNQQQIEVSIALNPILVTALNPVIGYELGAKIAKKAYAEKRPIKAVALERTDLSEQELDKLLDAMALTKGGTQKKVSK